MVTFEMVLFWLTIFIYVGVFGLELFGYVSRKKNIQALGIHLMWAGFVAHTLVGIMRWINAGHAPVTDAYELNITGTWFMVLIFLLFIRMEKIERAIAIVVTPITFLVLGYGFVLRTDAIPMGPAFRSPWLIVHVVFAWLAFGCYAIATGAAIMLLARAKTTPLETLDVTSYRFTVLGFVNHAVMLVSGAIWAKKLWGHYWSWDPLETWSLIAFLYYALVLHVRSFWKWTNRRAAWLTVLGLLILAISFWGVKWFGPGPHPGP